VLAKFPNLQTLTLKTWTIGCWQEASHIKRINKPFGAARKNPSYDSPLRIKQWKDDAKADLEFARSLTRYIIQIKSGKLSKLVLNLGDYNDKSYWKLLPEWEDRNKYHMRLFVSTWNWVESFTRATFKEHKGSKVVNCMTIDC